MPVNGLPSSPSTISLAPPVEAGFEGAVVVDDEAEGVASIAMPLAGAAFGAAAVTGLTDGTVGIGAPAFEADGGLTDTD